jgi:hypothetical protein
MNQSDKKTLQSGMLYIDPDLLMRAVDTQIQSLVTDSIDRLINDPEWINRIEQHIETNVVSRVSQHISDIDISLCVAQEVKKNFDSWRDTLKQDLHRVGVQDTATSCELVISDGAVVAQSGLACENLLVEQDITVKNLIVTGTVNTDCVSWNELSQTVCNKTQDLLGDAWRQQLVHQVLEQARNSGIDFDSITVRGNPLVQGHELNCEIWDTAIQQLGTLKNLRVQGPTNLDNTLMAGNKRVGINTDQPDMALSIWDEEVGVSVGKISRDRAWIGSNRQHALDIGVNRKKSLSIESDGLVSVERLRLDRWRISFGNAVPNHSGTRGDLVINHDPRPGSPFAWQCQGGFQWRSLFVTCE